VTNWRRKIKREVPGGGAGQAHFAAAALAHANAAGHGRHNQKKPKLAHTIQYDMAAKSAGAAGTFDAVTKCENVDVSFLTSNVAAYPEDTRGGARECPKLTFAHSQMARLTPEDVCSICMCEFEGTEDPAERCIKLGQCSGHYFHRYFTQSHKAFPWPCRASTCLHLLLSNRGHKVSSRCCC